ncbi:MAG: hypothetical protein BZ136_09025 [Methanosphaera sp. rholeuAM74]|nr:MAG: hypothetical protein BZ136_09025 [Methanosphaera sp. rholeuAM74]
MKKVKDKQSQENIKSKMVEIANTVEFNPDHYKNLKKPMQKYKRSHVNNSFVLIFRIDEENKKVIFFDYSHHDSSYKK